MKIKSLFFLIFILLTIQCFGKFNVGIVKSGFDINECRIFHTEYTSEKFEENCTTGTLYIGDIIFNPSSIKDIELELIGFANYEKIDDNAMKIVHSESYSKNSILSIVTDFIESFLEPKELSKITSSTKSGDGEINICTDFYLPNILPFPNSTFLPSYKVEFKWNKLDINSIVFIDKSGKNINISLTNKENSLFIKPDNFITTNRDYEWFFKGNKDYEKYPVRLLSKEEEKKIVNEYKKIELNIEKNMNSDAIDKTIQIAIFFQLVSDKNREIDLYWLSYQTLKNLFTNISKKIDVAKSDNEKKIVASQKFKVCSLIGRAIEHRDKILENKSNINEVNK